VLSNEDKAVNSAVVSVSAKLFTKSNAWARRPGSGKRMGEMRLVKKNHGRQIVFSWSLAETGRASLVIYDSRGRCIDQIFHCYELSCEHAIAWKCDAFPEGMYYYRLNTGDRKIQGKVAVVRE
jgi:hypothetical protein